MIERQISRAKLQEYADAPLDNAARCNKIWLPVGRRSPPQAARPEPAAGSLTKAQMAERATKQHTAKVLALFDYYATTTVPFDRIAAHMKQPIATVRGAMKERGRLS